jgi:hypothetical protein
MLLIASLNINMDSSNNPVKVIRNSSPACFLISANSPLFLSELILLRISHNYTSSDLEVFNCTVVTDVFPWALDNRRAQI